MKNGLLRIALEGFDDKEGKWVGFDLDGTLAYYDEWKGIEHIGAPIEAMILRVKQYLEEGVEVRIFTARVAQPTAQESLDAIRYIKEWCLKHIGVELAVTNVKDSKMLRVYDDRAVGVIENEGTILLPPQED